MNLFARSLLGLALRTAIGSSISIVWRGMTYWMFLPWRRALIASLSYVISTSPLPERNVLVAFEPDVSCETTLRNSFWTYTIPWASVFPRWRCAPYAARTFHFADREVKGLGVISWTSGLIRSSQPLIFFGLPSRRAKTTTVSAAIPP